MADCARSASLIRPTGEYTDRAAKECRMDCASCGLANPPSHRFCGSCGQPLAARCPACGSESAPGVKAVFGAPRVAEDDAIRAVRAAVAMQRAFTELAEAQAGAVGHTGLRVAVNTGEVIASEGSEIIGDPVNVAARLQEQASSGDV